MLSGTLRHCVTSISFFSITLFLSDALSCVRLLCRRFDALGSFEGVRSRISGDQVTLVGSMPNGGAFSCVLSGSQARVAVKTALAEIQRLAKVLDGEDGYPIGLDGLMNGVILAQLVG